MRNERLLAKLRTLTVTTSRPEYFNGNILQLTEADADATFKAQVTNRASKDEFKDEIVDAFAKNHSAERGSITIENLVGEGTNRHFIITHNEKKWHAKTALHGKIISFGTPFNEFAHYKLNEHLRIGPRCYGFVSKEGVVMILTEDLGFRSLNGKTNKKNSFSDNKNSEEKLKSIPNRERDSVHRCTAEIAKNLLSLFDINDNLGNTGIKSSKVNDAEIKEKLFILDFTLNPFDAQKPIDMKTYADSLARILIPSSEQPPSEQPPSEQPLSETSDKKLIIPKFNESPEVIGAALMKLFLDDDGKIKKFETDIKNAFNESRELLKSYKIEDPKTEDSKTEDSKTEDTKADYKIPHLEALEAQEVKLLERLNTFLENECIRTFLKEAGPKHKQEQLEKKKLKEEKLEKEIPPKDLTPADNSHKQLSKPQEPGPSLH